MSITDELRGAAHYMADPTHDFLPLVVSGDLLAIADRIDATYEEDVNTACKLANSLSADELDERGWIRLPLDADGVPIHIGDRLTDSVEYKSEGIVKRLMVEPTGWSVNFDAGWSDERFHDWHHYTPPTVEDVLREFASDIADVLGGDDFRLDGSDELFAEYAAKLRLAGEDE